VWRKACWQAFVFQEFIMADQPRYNRRSHNITEGVARSPNRSMYYALGYRKDDFDKPMIGIANGHSTITPCNSGLQKLADIAVATVKQSGANPQVFGTPTISDGMSMGTEGMKFSLISREVIADCIETCVNGQWMDGVVVIGGCDKNMPGGMIALARTNVPGIYVYGGTIKPGNWKGKDLTVVSVFEAVGEFTAGRMSEEDFDGIERNACPSSARAAACIPPTRCRPRSRRSACRCCIRRRWPTRTTKRSARRRNRRACWSRRSSAT